MAHRKHNLNSSPQFGHRQELREMSTIFANAGLIPTGSTDTNTIM